MGDPFRCYLFSGGFVVKTRYALPSLGLAVTILALWALSACTSHAVQGSPGGTIEVHFQPGGGATAAIVHELSLAQKTIHVQAYSFTSAPIAQALVDAKRRGVDVEVVLDKSNRTERYSAATFLVNQGIPTYIDAQHAIAHSKNIIIDGAVIITGSFNFTKAAEERNAETSLILRGYPDLAKKFEANFALHKGHSEPYQRRSG
jgi:phosphatidylserine/phosphatidylglycerophosphate/cardiolipin synthase-like enzyme